MKRAIRSSNLTLRVAVLSVLAAALAILAVACSEAEPTDAPTPSPMPTASAIQPPPAPSPAPTPGDVATAIAAAVATALAGVADNESPTPDSSPGPGHTPGSAPTPAPPPTSGEPDGMAATATAAAVINAQTEAMIAAVNEVFEKLILDPNVNRDEAIAAASARTGADPNAVATAIAEAYDNPITPTFTPTEVFIATANAQSEANALATAAARAGATATVDPAVSDAVASDRATATAHAAANRPQRYDSWNDHEWMADPKPWWKPSNPYDCDPPANSNSPWTAAGLPDLGGQDPLSLIRWFGNGSYVRYGLMGFEGCTFMRDHPERTHLDIPADPTYYSLGDLEIAVDIARVPVGAPEWSNDNGVRVDMSMDEAVSLLNTHVAAYFRKISEGKLRMSFVPGVEFTPSGRGTPQDVESEWLALIGVPGCSPATNRSGCPGGMPGALNRIFLNDVNVSSGGSAWNGHAELGLVSLEYAIMKVIVHEIGHGWMLWPHSYTELPWRPDPTRPYQRPNPYSSAHDFMSQLTPDRPSGWFQDMPATLAINRYAAGWIEPDDVALHLSEQGTYTLARPRQSGEQFLVIHSGRTGAFTTLEALDDRNAAYNNPYAVVYDHASPNQRRPLRYEGVLVSRYDQTTGTGINARVGPALYNTANPNYESDVGYGYDDFSVIGHGESRSIGGGVTVSVTKNPDGSYNVSVSGGKTAEYEPWCVPIWFTGEYDSGCHLENFNF